MPYTIIISKQQLEVISRALHLAPRDNTIDENGCNVHSCLIDVIDYTINHSDGDDGVVHGFAPWPID